MSSLGSHSTAALSWDVCLPERRRAALGTQKPRGTLIIYAGSDNEEQLKIPLSVARILRSKRRSGEINPGSRAELLFMVGELSRTCAQLRIERLINRREYARSEVVEKLRQDGYNPQIIEDCVARACEIGLVSDARYADSFIRSKVYAGWGMARIERELSRKGIDVAQVRGWPYDYLDPEDELTRAVDIASTRRVSGATAYQKLVRFLCGRGFSTSVASRAARQVLDTRNDEAIIVDF